MRLPKKLIIGLIFVFATLNVWLWYFLTFNPPKNVFITDVSHNEAVVVWSSSKPTTSTIYYSKNSVLLKLLPLTIPFVSLERNNIKTTNHRITIPDLKPKTTYHFSVAENLHFYPASRITTLSFASMLWTFQGITETDTLVVGRTTTGTYFSSLTDVRGNFYLNISSQTKEKALFITVFNGLKKIKSSIVPEELFGQINLLK